MKYTISRNDIEVCRQGNFVYIRNYKCASTFFYWNFVNKFLWKEISYHDIDWDQDHVFSHILDPIERRHKGVAEKIHMHRASRLFLENETLQQSLAHACLLDNHTETYSTRFLDKAWLIDWIPLNRSHQEVIDLTEKLLEQKLDWNMDWVHYGDNSKNSTIPGDNLKKQVELKLREIWNSQGQPEWLQAHYYSDQELYNAVISGFNNQGVSWAEMSWLNNKR